MAKTKDSPKSRYKSEVYLDFIREKRCCVCGAPHPDAHHEGVFKKGGVKRLNDFQALPLCHIDCHLEGIHKEGKPFWVKRDIDPIELVLINLIEYRDSIKPTRFDTFEDYFKELEVVSELIEELGELGYEEE